MLKWNNLVHSHCCFRRHYGNACICMRWWWHWVVLSGFTRVQTLEVQEGVQSKWKCHITWHNLNPNLISTKCKCNQCLVDFIVIEGIKHLIAHVWPVSETIKKKNLTVPKINYPHLCISFSSLIHTISASLATLALEIIRLQTHSISHTLHIQQQINLTVAHFTYGIYYGSELQFTLLFKINSIKHLLSQRLLHFPYV